MTFHVGQKVVCIAEKPWFNPSTTLPQHGPTLNSICIIRGFDKFETGLLLEGFSSNFYFDGSEQGYSQHHFRPIVERKTDISIFTKMLTPSDEKIGASA